MGYLVGGLDHGEARWGGPVTGVQRLITSGPWVVGLLRRKQWINRDSDPSPVHHLRVSDILLSMGTLAGKQGQRSFDLSARRKRLGYGEKMMHRK
jgi:hypothetical protein